MELTHNTLGEAKTEAKIRIIRKSRFGFLNKIGIALMAVVVAVLLFVTLVPGFGMLIVKSGSMTGTINTGDIIFTAPPTSVGLGDIITYQMKKDMLVTHRVVAINPNGTYLTRGDANEDVDTTPVRFSQIVGTYLFKVPSIGYVTNFIRTKNGWFIAIIIPAMILVGLLIKDILKEAFKSEKKEDKTA